jgi:hypothetical protein
VRTAWRGERGVVNNQEAALAEWGRRDTKAETRSRIER